ncbi:MAG: class I SAM-dependent methyltransferase [Deltaproteobacteria bacterium]|nr:class I SAM-dependent methyltransferase [Deltaproteobacteria bacterium]
MKVCLACGQRFEADNWNCSSCNQSPVLQDGHPVFAPELIYGDGSDVEYDYAYLFEVESKNFWFRARNRLLLWALEHYFPGGNNFLEVGCGTGFVLSGIRQTFPELILSASDVLVKGLAYANQRLPSVSFSQMDARNIPFEAEFDIIGAFDVLEHIEEDTLTLSQLFQATRPGGGIILTVPQHPFLWSYLDDFSYHKRRYIRSELVAKVEQAGFEILRATSFVFLLLPLLYISRLMQRQPINNHDVGSELRLNPLLNVSLEKILDLERILIKLGLSFPVGGSLLVIAKRPEK